MTPLIRTVKLRTVKECAFVVDRYGIIRLRGFTGACAQDLVLKTARQRLYVFFLLVLRKIGLAFLKIPGGFFLQLFLSCLVYPLLDAPDGCNNFILAHQRFFTAESIFDRRRVDIQVDVDPLQFQVLPELVAKAVALPVFRVFQFRASLGGAHTGQENDAEDQRRKISHDNLPFFFAFRRSSTDTIV